MTARRRSSTLRDLKREIAAATRRSGDGHEIGGTGLTILKHQASPLARLADAGRIGAEELRAADEITRVFMATAGALMIRGGSVERVDRSGSAGEPAWLADAQAHYRAWADIWSVRAKRGDPSLEIVIAAVIDERPFRAIEVDLRLRHGRAAAATVAALRDYAARAGWTDRHTATAWIDGAAGQFKLRRNIS